MKIYWKILFLRGDHEEPIYRWELPKKGALRHFSGLRGIFAKKGGWCFWGAFLFHILLYVYTAFYFHCYNLGQKVGDKFTKLSKRGFSMECFTANFLRFFTGKRENLAGYLPSNPSVLGIFLKLPNFLSRSATREAIRAFAFWW